MKVPYSAMDEERLQIYLRLDCVLDELFDIFPVGKDDIIDAVCELFKKRSSYIFNCEGGGHLWENDQCGLPQHRYCLICQVLIDPESLRKQQEQEELDKLEKM